MFRRKFNEIQRKKAMALSKIGARKFSEEDYDGAIKYYTLAINSNYLIKERSAIEEVSLAVNFSNLALAYQAQNNLEGTFNNLQQAISIMSDVGEEKDDHYYFFSKVCQNFGYFHFLNGNIAAALEWTQIALEKRKKINESPEGDYDNFTLAALYKNLGYYYSCNNQAALSMQAFKTAISYMKEIKFLHSVHLNELIFIYEELAIACENHGNFAEAERALKKLSKWKEKNFKETAQISVDLSKSLNELFPQNKNTFFYSTNTNVVHSTAPKYNVLKRSLSTHF